MLPGIREYDHPALLYLTDPRVRYISDSGCRDDPVKWCMLWSAELTVACNDDDVTVACRAKDRAGSPRYFGIDLDRRDRCSRLCHNRSIPAGASADFQYRKAGLQV